MASKKRLTLEDELNALAAADVRTAGGRKQLEVALCSERQRVVARAATMIRERHVDGLESLLVQAFDRFLVDGAKTDPGCVAKSAIIDTLDALESSDAEFFLKATRVVQPEPAWKTAADAAGVIRARALYALARLGFPDLILLAGEAFSDSQHTVRLAAAEALAHFGVRHGAGLLLLAMAKPEEDPLVTLASMSALLSLAPEVGLPRLTTVLRGEDAETRELAALALGQSNRADALDVLITALDVAGTSRNREPLFKAVALHRSDRAINVLLELLGSETQADAQAALEALATRRFEPGVRSKVEARVNSTLRRLFNDMFPV